MNNGMKRPAIWTMIMIVLLLMVVGTVQARYWFRGGTTIYYSVDRSCTDGIELSLADVRETAGDLPLGLEAWNLLNGLQIVDTMVQLPEQSFEVPGVGPQPHGDTFIVPWSTTLEPGTRVRLIPDTFDPDHDVISVNITVQNCELSDAPIYPVRYLYEKELDGEARNVPPDVEKGGGAACVPGVDVTTSTIEVPDDVVIDDLNVALHLDHTFDASTLEVTLTSPQGTSVMLMARNSVGKTLDFGTQCRWDRTNPDNGERLIGEDTADFILDDESAFQFGDPAYTWEYQHSAWIPTGPGSLSDFYGENAAGTWTLDVCDTVPERQGYLECWFLEVLDTRTVSLTQDTYTAGEGDGSVEIEVALSETTTEATEVSYETVPAPGSNQLPQSGTVQFAPRTASDPGEQKKSFMIQIADDGDVEADETVLVKLSAPTNDFNLVDPSEAQVIIQDDDIEPADSHFSFLPALIFAADSN